MKKMLSILSLISVVAVAMVTSTQCTNSQPPIAPTFVDGNNPLPAGKSWRYVDYLSDEFNVDGLDTNKWCADPTANGWSWQGGDDGLFLPEAIDVRGGNLVITAGVLDEPRTLDTKGDGVEETFHYFCGLVRTLKPGDVGKYYECSMKMNKSELGGGFWLMAHPSAADVGTRHEIDIQECVGAVSERTEEWGLDWDHIVHGNAINHPSINNDDMCRDEDCKYLDEKNSDRFMVYGAWWKSPTEILFYLDGEYLYTLTPPVDFDIPSHVQMSIQVYSWNLVPEDGGEISRLPLEDRETLFDWVRVWEIE